MTFFYDMNKRLAEIDKNNKSVKQLNEAFVPPKLEEPDEKVEIDMPSGTNFNFSSTRPGDFTRMAQSQGGSNSFVSTEPGDLARAFKPPKQYQRTEQDFGLPDEDLREMMRMAGLAEKLHGKQHRLDVDKNGKLEKSDFAKLRASGMNEDDMEEGNEFTGALDAAGGAGEKTFDVDGRTYPVKKGITEGFKNTYSVGDRVNSPMGTGTIVAVSKNINVDGRVRVKLDDPSLAGEDGKYKDTFELDTTQLNHISKQGVAEGSYYPGEHGPEGVAIPDKTRQRGKPGGTYWAGSEGPDGVALDDPNDVMHDKKPMVKKLEPKARAKTQMVKMYGDGKITFRKTSNGGYFIQHEDDFGDTHSHQFDPKTGKVDFSGVTRSSYYGEGVAETERQPGRFSGAWQILVNGKKVHSFRGNFDQETADRVGVVKAADRGLYNPGSGDKIKIVPVMLDQNQGVAEDYYVSKTYVTPGKYYLMSRDDEKYLFGDPDSTAGYDDPLEFDSLKDILTFYRNMQDGYNFYPVMYNGKTFQAVSDQQGVAEDQVKEAQTYGPDNPYQVEPGEDFSKVFEPGRRSGVHYHLNTGMITDPFYFKLNNKLYSVSNKGDGIPREVGTNDRDLGQDVSMPSLIDYPGTDDPNLKLAKDYAELMGYDPEDMDEIKELLMVMKSNPAFKQEVQTAVRNQDNSKKPFGNQGVAEGKQRVNIGKKLGENKKRRPDFPDLDNDKNTTEPISRAATDAARGRKIAGKAYGGAAQKDDADQEQPRRRGRPDEGGPKHTYDAPFGNINVPAWQGPRTVHKIGDAEPGKEARRRGRPKKVREEMIDRPDPNEYDREGEMAKTQLRTASDAADELRSILDSDENLPEWVQSKITKAVDYLDTARDYMKSTDSKELEPIAERPRSENQRIAAAIALKAKREGHRPKPGTASAEMAGMSEKELKKFAKKPKGETLPKRVKETTTSGSVTVSDATADNSAKPKKSKSGVTFGKGIYDSWNRELEVMISEAMDISVNQTTQDDGTIKKTINVNATDEDAEKLADLLNLAGLDQHDDDHTCPVCGQEPCECAEMVDENSPNWPTSTEYNEDSLQYSGGLNGPKSTGQTTVPIIASQLDRQIAESDDLMAQELDRIRKFIGK